MTNDNTEYVFVTEYFYPDTASTGQLITELVTGLNDRGLDMTVYTGQPNYHSGENKRQPYVTTHDGVLVKRIRAPQLRQTSLPRRLFNWVVFTIWMSIVLLVSTTDSEREIIFVSNPPFLPLTLWPVCRLRQWEFTYIVHDLYPDQPRELGYISEGGVIDRVWSIWHQYVFQDAKHIIALGSKMRDNILEKTDSEVSKSDITIIHNWEDSNFISPIEKENNWFSKKHNLTEPFTILYSGNIAEFHDLETLIKASSKLKQDNVKFLIIGEGDNKQTLIELAKSIGVKGDTVEFLPYQPREDLPHSLTAGDVTVVTVKEGFEGVCVSSKLYSAMATGQPILCIAQPTDDEAQLVKEFNAGITVSQGDVNGIIEAIETWRQNPQLLTKQGQNARKAFENHFTKRNSIDEYYDLLSH